MESSKRTASVVTFYMAAALVMVFVNKAVLNSSPELPLLFLFIQLIIAIILLHASALISSKIEIPRYDLYTARKLFPLVLVNVVGLVFNTLCLRGVQASFFQIARGLVLPLTIAVSSAATHSSPSARVVTAAVMVTAGFFLGLAPDNHVPVYAIPSTLSLFYGVLASLCIAVHSVLIKSSLPYCGNSTIQLAYWTNAGSALFLVPLVLLKAEPVKLLAMTRDFSWDMDTFIWGSLVTGVFGFLLCVAGLLSIKVTSPITHMFSSAARSVIQTLVGHFLFYDNLSLNRVVSLLIILFGTMYYTWVKSTETAPPPPRPVDLEAWSNGDRQTKPDQEVIWQASEKIVGEEGERTSVRLA